jgi:hypothetical protein
MRRPAPEPDRTAPARTGELGRRGDSRRPSGYGTTIVNPKPLVVEAVPSVA